VSFSQYTLLVMPALFLGCGAAPTGAERHVQAAPAVSALRDGRFEDATKQAGNTIGKDPQNPEALLVRAITRYRATTTQLVLDAETTLIGLDAGRINQRYLQTAGAQAEADLAAIEADLAEVDKSPDVSMELCLACWKGIDWTGDGRVNQRDELLLQIETDAHGEPLPEGDPRRTPTFHFDKGDVAWARAFVGFERAALDVVLAYDYTGLDEVLASGHDRPKHLVLKLVAPERIGAAKERLLEALDQSEAARQAYLAETDDDREWVPNPRQKSHPMPLPVDQALFETWGGVVSDVRHLAKGDEGIALVDIQTLLKGEWEVTGARGFIDIGAMLSRPRDITLDERDIELLDKEPTDLGKALAAILGEYYVAEMKPSPLPKRLLRMKGELDAHAEDIEHKLRYLFWLN